MSNEDDIIRVILNNEFLVNQLEQEQIQQIISQYQTKYHLILQPQILINRLIQIGYQFPNQQKYHNDLILIFSTDLFLTKILINKLISQGFSSQLLINDIAIDYIIKNKDQIDNMESILKQALRLYFNGQKNLQLLFRENYEALQNSLMKLISKQNNFKSQQTSEIIESYLKTENKKQILQQLVSLWYQNYNDKGLYYCCLIVQLLKQLQNTNVEIVLTKLSETIEQLINSKRSNEALYIWKHLTKFLNIEIENQQTKDYINSIPDLEEKESDQTQNSTKDPISKPTIEPTTNSKSMYIPKYLHDCVLCLTSQDSNRIWNCLQSLEKIIRSNLCDLHIHTDLLVILFKLHYNQCWREHFEEPRLKSIVAILIYDIQQSSQQIQKLFVESSIPDKHLVLSILLNSCTELSDNPQKYENDETIISQFNDQSLADINIISTKYFSQQEKDQEKLKQEERMQKLSLKSKRWGYTKKNYEDNLKPLKKNELKLKNAYINRFNLFLNEIFFSFIRACQIKLKNLLLSNQMLLKDVLIVITRMLECAKFSNLKSDIIKETTDFINIFKAQEAAEVNQLIWKVIIKMAFIIDKNFILANPSLYENVMALVNSIKANNQIDLQFRSIAIETLISHLKIN